MMQVERRTIEALLWKLQNSPGIVRLQAAQALGYLKDPRAVLPLIAALHAERKPLRVQAAQSLVSIGLPAVAPLIQVLREDDPQCWMLASAALVKIGRPAVPTILEVLPEEIEPVQILLIEILGQIGDASAVDVLVQALASSREGLQAAAVVALTRIGAPVVRPLINHLGDFQNPHTQSRIMDIFRVIGTPAISVLLTLLIEGTAIERSHAAWILSQTGTAVVTVLLKALQVEDIQVRYAAAWALGCTASAAAVPALVLRLDDQEKSPLSGMRVCDVAAKALEAIATPEALAAVQGWQASRIV